MIETAIYIARWTAAIPVGILFVLCAVANWGIIVAAIIAAIRGEEFSSSFVLPFFGPALGVLFLALLPLSGSMTFWWAAFLADPTWLIGIWGLLTAPFRSSESE